MASNQHDALLRQAAEAAREGRKLEARAIVQQVLNEDEENVRAWMLMYRLSDSIAEKRMALTTILQLDPDNARAREALSKLDRRAGFGEDEEEVVPGVTRRQLLIFGGGALVVVLLLFIVIIVVVNAINAPQQAAESVAVAFEQTETSSAVIIAGTATAEIEATIMEMTQTTATPTPTETRVGPPTLPPTFTATPTATPPITATSLPLPADIGGVIYGWGGPDQINDGYFPILALELGGGGEYRVISGGERGQGVTAEGRNRIYYARIFQNFQTLVDTVDLVTGEASLLNDQYQDVSTQRFAEVEHPYLSQDGALLAFTGISATNATREVYIFDSRQVGVSDPIIRLTDDISNYFFPALSPDNTNMVVVRETQTDLQTNTDLFIQNIQTLQTQPFTTDGNVTIETMPRWSPDGRIIAYAARAEGEDNHDLYIRAADGSSQALRITSSPADDIYPVFSPDSRYIAFASDRQGSYNIYIYDQQTGMLSQLTNAPDDFFPGDWEQ